MRGILLNSPKYVNCFSDNLDSILYFGYNSSNFFHPTRPSRIPMKITDVEVIPLRIPEHNIDIADGIQDDVIVRVHTDEGITGIGEADSSPLVVKAIVEAWSSWPRCRGLREVLVGRNPMHVEQLWQEMQTATLWLGRNGVAQQAIAAIDIALWDIVGKATGK